MNTFYQAFDLETLGQAKRPEDYRSPFQIDRDRILHTSAFRSLQSKTQVFLAGEYDFYRTRLTHSIEVAQIGRSLCQFLKQRSSDLAQDHFIDPDLVEAICLAHDLGHPPFGHVGERTLNQLLAQHGGFEGNAQTLRLLTSTLYQGTRGIQPTRALLDGVLKYKTLRAELLREGAAPPANHFLYDEQASDLDFALGDQAFPPDYTPGPSRNAFRSIECQLMDWADDTAYSIHDLTDGVKAGFLTIERIERWAAGQDLAPTQSHALERLLASIREGKLEARLGRRIGDFIQAVSLADESNFLTAQTQRYRYRLAIQPEIEVECRLYKAIATDLIFKSRELQQLLDFKAARLLGQLWEPLWANYLGSEQPEYQLLTPHHHRLLVEADTEASKARRLADALAELTDRRALKMHRRLFDTDFASLTDLG
ncbi:MAG: dGTP triphosphohydrolase [Verrucomicrobiota bacterium]